MSCLFCMYCFGPVEDENDAVLLPFSPHQVVSFHTDCYECYCEKCSILQRALQSLIDGSYKTRIHPKEKQTILTTTVPDQAEKDYTCPICFDRIADRLLLPCHHRICNECLLDWRRNSLRKKHKGTQCCFCRQTIQEITVIK